MRERQVHGGCCDALSQNQTCREFRWILPFDPPLKLTKTNVWWMRKSGARRNGEIVMILGVAHITSVRTTWCLSYDQLWWLRCWQMVSEYPNMKYKQQIPREQPHQHAELYFLLRHTREEVMIHLDRTGQYSTGQKIRPGTKENRG